MNCHYSPESGAVSMDQNCSVGKQSATSKTIRTASELSEHGSTMVYSTLRQSSLTSESSLSPVSLTNTMDLQTWLQQDSPASHSLSRVDKVVKTTSAISGRIRSNVLAEYVPDLRTWRMSQASLFPNTLERYSPTWPQSGMTVNGRLYQRQKSGANTYVNAYGFWLTPVASDSKRGKNQFGNTRTLTNQILSMYPNGYVLNPAFIEKIMGFPIGSTELKPLAMHKFHRFLRRHGIG